MAHKDLINHYEEKKEEIKLKPVKLSHSLICGTFGCVASMSLINIPKFDSLPLTGLGGFLAGYTLPYVVKNVKILELDYQIFMNKNIINDLEKERLEKFEERKTLQKTI